MHRAGQEHRRVFGAINERQGALRELIVNSNNTFEATASRDEALAETFAIFPTFLDESKATLARLEDFSRNTHPLVNDLKGPADDLGPTCATSATSRPTSRAVPRPRPADPRRAAPALPALERTLRERRAAVRGAPHVLPGAQPDPVLPRTSTRRRSPASSRTAGSDLAADYGTGQRGSARSGIIEPPLVRGVQARRRAAGLGARQRLPAPERADCAR